jgi:beta-glucosidase
MTEPNTASAAQHAFAAGLDVVFQSQYGQQRPYLDAFQRGLIPLATIDAAVRRILRVKFELGLFEQPYVDAAVADRALEPSRRLARDAARESIVLLKNDAGTLPLAKSLRSIVVIGIDAEEARFGGYSGSGNRTVSILDGIRGAVSPATRVQYVPGPGRAIREFVVVPSSQLTTEGETARGLSGQYFDNPWLQGQPRLTRTDARIDFRWTLNSPGRGIPFDWYSARWTGSVAAPAGGVGRIGVEANDGYRLWLDDQLVIDNWQKKSFGTRTVPVSWRAGSVHRIKLEYFETTGVARVKLIWNAGVTDTSREAITEAVSLAKASDAALIVAGVEEGEFQDRAKLGLPGRQAQLIEAVAATGTPTIVVLIGGSAITMPWLEHADAVLDAWYPGEAGGEGVADVLFGDFNPAGRLPITFPIAEGQLPLHYNHKPTGRGDDYVDLTGMALFPFGYGQSYTTFEYSDLRIEPAEIGATGRATVRFTVKNTGARAGDEVAQLYIRDLLATVARPVMELRGFERAKLAPGEQRDLSFTLGPEALRLLDQDMKWVVEPGTFRVMVGASSKDIRLRGQLVVK